MYTPNRSLELADLEFPRPHRQLSALVGAVPPPPPSPSPPKRIAVIAIHGVSDQQPSDTARSISNLLLNLDRGIDPNVPTDPNPLHAATPPAPGTQYTPFAEEKIRIAVRPLLVGQDPPPQTDAGHEFMREQLAQYHTLDPAQTYDTLRLRGFRLSGPPGTAAVGPEVHVYEMYWADLSRLGTGILDVFGELAQILFHLPDLGKHTARQTAGSGFLCRAFAALHALSADLLTLIIPVLNLLMFIIAAFAFAAIIPPAVYIPGATVGFALLLLATLAAVAYFRSFPLLLSLPLAIVVPPLIALLLIFHPTMLGATLLLAIEGALLAAVAIVPPLLAYARRKNAPRRIFFQATAAGLLFFTFLIGLLPSHSPDGRLLATAAMHTVECLFLALTLAWILFGILQLPLSVAAAAIALFPREPRMRPALLTACFTLWVPAALFLVAVIPFNAAFISLVKHRFDGIPYQPLIYTFDGPQFISDFARHLVLTAATPGFVFMLLFVALGALVALIAYFPAVFSDLRPPRSDAHADRLGKSLDAAIAVFPAIVLTFFLTSFFLPFAIAATLPIDAGLLASLRMTQHASETLLYAIAGLLLFSTTGLVAFRGRLQSLALGFRTPVDALLDVDNHLRKFPLNNNPRSQIAARCASLLRYVRNWTDPNDASPQPPGYDAVIIISHSQGTAIAAETLRFAALEQKEALVGAELPPTPRQAAHPQARRYPSAVLFTMGSPLLQLYRWRFPHLYSWVDTLTPEQLRIAAWVNAYRSADYVGRKLWENPPTNAFQYCVGAGAHTHYWDALGTPIAQILDRLISTA